MENIRKKNNKKERKVMKKLNLLLMIFFTLFIQKAFSLDNDDMIGYWKIPSGKSIIRIDKEGDSFSGYVVWLKEPVYGKNDKESGKAKYDRYNSNKELRNRPVIGLKVAGNLVLESKTKLKNGWVYDPFHGKKYTGTVEIIDKNTIRIRGSIDKNSFFGYTQECKRVDPLNYVIKN